MKTLPPIVMTVPADKLWLDGEQAARQIGYTTRVFMEKISVRPDFPKASRIDGTGFPRWNAAEIDAWMRAQRDKTGGRKRAA
jgi:predicted DNA-binding transcriptional regulator AlpA